MTKLSSWDDSLVEDMGRLGAEIYPRSHDHERALALMSAGRSSVICLGCGSRWTNSRLAEEKRSNPKLRSCCPEREMVTLKQARRIINKLRIDDEVRG